MSKLVHISCSPRTTSSHSSRVARAFIETYVKKRPSDETQCIDLWNINLPELDETRVNITYKTLFDQDLSDTERENWTQVQELAQSFADADKYLFSLPMWNFGIPYKLKHFIDVVTLNGITFDYSLEGGVKGRMTGKPVILICSSGMTYAAANAEPYTEQWDFQVPYLRAWLTFLGFSAIESVLIRPTVGEPTVVSASEQEALRQAEILARSF